MNISKFTQKTMEAYNRSALVADEFGNQEIVTEHLLYALLTIDDSLIVSIMKKMDISEEVLLAQVEGLINKRPKVSGGEPYVGRDFNKVVTYAEDEAKAMKDAYVSVEHVFLSILKHGSD